jgi:seryl-tRNA synthetase
MVDDLGLAGDVEAAAKMTGKAFVCVMPAKADLESEA